MTEPLTPWTAVETTPSPLGPAACIVGTAILDELETEHHEVFEVVAADTLAGPEELTRAVPNAAEEALAHLDEHGIVRPGSTVHPGDLLVGKVAPRQGPTPSAEEKLLRAIFGEAPGEVVDRSLRAPPGVEGTVTVARLEDGGARAVVEVSWTRPLEIGDVLVDDQGHRAVVAGIEDLAEDLRWRDGEGPRRIAKAAIARDTLHARSIGPYSLVTQRPLASKVSFGGQRVSAELVATLVGAGNPWAAWELLIVKSDSVRGRTLLYESVVKGEHHVPREADGHRLPESAQVAQRELFALGLDTDLDADRVEGRWLTTEAIREASSGRITKPETINYRTLLPEAGGLFCARVFGPVRDYGCLCGKYTRMRDRGVVCEDCGVEVTHSRVRRERFGHVELPVPLPHPWRLGELAERLGVSVEDVRARLFGDDADPQAAIEACGPWDGFLEAVPVLPPDLRPLVPLDGGRFAASDLNDLYRRLLNRSNRLSRLMELAAPDVIVRNEIGQAFAALEALFDNARVAKPLQFEGRQLRSLRDMVETHLGEDLVCKTVDYSGVAHLVVDPDLDEGMCRLPLSVACELFKPFAYALMEARGFGTDIRSRKAAVHKRLDYAVRAVRDVSARLPVLLATDGAVASRSVALWDQPAIAVAPETARALASEHAVIHLLMTAEAVAAARSWGNRVLPLQPWASTPSGWLGEVVTGGDLRKAARAAAEGHADPISEPVLRVALGRWPGAAPTVAQRWLDAELVGPQTDPSSRVDDAWFDLDVDDLESSVRLSGALQAAGIRTVGALAKASDAELLAAGLKRRDLDEVHALLADLRHG